MAHDGMDPNNMTISVPAVPGPEVIGHIAGDIFAAFLKLGVPDQPEPRAKLTQLSKDIAFAVVNEISKNAKITITVSAGPPPTATATIE